MRFFIGAAVLSFALAAAAQQYQEAPTGFDNKSNGVADDMTHQADQMKFDEVEGLADGLGPLYNAQSCRECHQNPTSGGTSQVTELRVGHLGPNQRFQNPEIPIAHGAETITGRSLVNLRAICPSEAFPNTEIQERVPDTETIRTTRISLNLLGDGFVEAVADQALIDLSRDQCKASHGKICGQVLYVPIVEAPGETGVGRFGWKDQQASLLSFSGDAYLNEMGVTNPLFPEENTSGGVFVGYGTQYDPVPDPEDHDSKDTHAFARFIRATKAPSRGPITNDVIAGEEHFNAVGCAICHVSSMMTARPGTVINGGEFIVPDALGNKIIHPFSDFLLHNIGTGDGIPFLPTPEFENTARQIKTAPLWALRTRNRLMHDGLSSTKEEAIQRHTNQAADVKRRFNALTRSERDQIMAFLDSL